MDAEANEKEKDTYVYSVNILRDLYSTPDKKEETET